MESKKRIEKQRVECEFQQNQTKKQGDKNE